MEIPEVCWLQTESSWLGEALTKALRNYCPDLGHLLGENHNIENLKSTEKPEEEKKMSLIISPLSAF